MDPRTRKLLEAPIASTLLRMALPNMVVMVVQASIGLIETYFVAKLGIDALAGMALVFPVLMLFVMISAGAMGGGILSSIARALGAGDRDGANALVWHAVAIGGALGVLTSVLLLLGGPGLYALMGGRAGSLSAAVAYSTVVFAGALPLWLFNSLAAVIRGTGNIVFPAVVVAIGAALLIPLSPALIFGFGPFPDLGIVGGASAVVIYYVIGSAVFAFYIWSGRGVLKPSLRPPRLSWAPLYEILRVGAISSIVSVSTNVSIAVATGLTGLVSPVAVAGYGTGARLEYLLVPLVFGLGAPLAAMVGSAIGARPAGARVAHGLDRRRNRRCFDRGHRADRRAVSACLARPVRQRADDDCGGHTLFAHGRPVLWLLRLRARALLCIAGRRPARLAGHVGRAPGRVGRRRRASGRSSEWRPRRAVRGGRVGVGRLRLRERCRYCGRRLVQAEARRARGRATNLNGQSLHDDQRSNAAIS